MTVHTAQARERRTLSMLVVVLGVITPIAGFFALRLSVSYPTVFSMLGLPWPEPWQQIVRIASIAFVIAGLASSIAAVSLGGSVRVRGIEMLIMLAIATPIVFLLFFISVFGDPGPV